MKIFFSTILMEYMVSPDGRIYSRRSGSTVLREIATYNGKGYRRVRLQGKTFKVHRLVAEAFIDNPDNLPYVVHIDGDKNNNNITNLRWSDKQTNHGD